MPKFEVRGIVSASKYVGTFTADTAQQALEMAIEEGDLDCRLCHQCARKMDDPEVDIESLEADEIA